MKKLIHFTIAVMEEHIQDGIELETEEPQQIPIDPFPLPFVPNPLLSSHLMGPNSALFANGLPTNFPYHFPISYEMSEQVQQQHELMQQDQQLKIFWANQLQEIKATTDFKNHNLPLARIKKIMKSDEDVKMIAAETPVLFSRACEMFILELTYRSWSQAEHNKRRTLQKSDICSAIAKYPMFDFLIDIVPTTEEGKDNRVPMDVGNDELNESMRCYYEPSRIGSLMMDMRLPEKVPHSLSFAKQHQEQNVQENANNSTPNVSE